MAPSPLNSALVETFEWLGDGGSTWRGADRTRWLRDPVILAGIGPALASLFPDAAPTVVMGPQSSGYSLGSLVAASIGAGFVGAEKKEKPQSDSDPWLSATTPLDYQGRNMQLSVRKRLLSGGNRVLIVDDWADTGGQLMALTKLVAQSDARLVGTAVIVDALGSNAVRRELGLRSLIHLRDLRSR